MPAKKPDKETAAHDLHAHLEAMGIESSVTAAKNVCVSDPRALLVHLTADEFIARDKEDREPRKGPRVPVHRIDNPIGALQEWTQQRGPNAKMPRYEQTENVGTVNAPSFVCTVHVDEFSERREASNKATAKHQAAMGMLKALAVKYGATQP